jgi:hypothetical protein
VGNEGVIQQAILLQMDQKILELDSPKTLDSVSSKIEII